ncbi:MAG: hypothetical protein S0880_19985 [Actinomycetota bacterium]|nr:hypothetical protein [Actinomycetota bacterium]
MPPAARPDQRRRSRSSRRRLRRTSAVLAAVAVLLAACGGDDDAPTAYGPTTENEFMELCSPGATPDGTGDDEAAATTVANDATSTVAVCGCAYDEIVETIPFERYSEELRGALRDGLASWPDEITEMMTDCVLAGLPADATGSTDGEDG